MGKRLAKDGVLVDTLAVAAGATVVHGTDFTSKVLHCKDIDFIGLSFDLTGSSSSTFTVRIGKSLDNSLWVDTDQSVTANSIVQVDVRHIKKLRISSIVNGDGVNAGQIKIKYYLEEVR